MSNNKSQTGNGGLRALSIIMIIIAAILLLSGSSALLDGLSKLTLKPMAMSDVTRNSVFHDSYYLVEDLVILDSFYSEESDSVTTHYCLAAFTDKNDEYCVTVLAIPETNKVYPKLYRYLNDTTAGYGDLVISCYIYTDFIPYNADYETQYNDLKKSLIDANIFYEEEFINTLAYCAYDSSMTIDEVARASSIGDFFAAIPKLFFAIAIGIAAFFLWKESKKNPNQAMNQNACYRNYLNNYQGQNNNI